MSEILREAGRALTIAAGMFWEVAWSLVLGFAISAVVQALVSKRRMREALGRDGAREIALATVFGAASSSCSYASAAIMRTIFKKGAALIPSLAFLFASTNLVVELGIVLYLLMGWQFTAAEWIGGLFLIAIMSVLVKLTYPARLLAEARSHPETGRAAHEHSGEEASGKGFWRRLASAENRVRIANNFVMDWRMLGKDLAAGFLIGGALAVFVPDDVWHTLFQQGGSPAARLIANALLGPIVAVLSFVCSIGNVPLAAILYAKGVSFGGVLSFLYADLIVLPLLDAYRRYFGWRMAAYIAGVFYATMVLSAIVMDLLFSAAGWVPRPRPDAIAHAMHFRIDYTFWLNLVFALLAAYLFLLHARNRGRGAHAHHEHHGCHGPTHEHRG